MRRRTFALSFIGLLIASGWLSPSALAAKTRKVLFIGIDGCRFDAVKVAHTPNLDALMADGCFDADCQILGARYQRNDTVSGPGWSSILTGVWADKHGVHNNSFTGMNYVQFPHLFARLKEVHPDAFTASVVTWAPIEEHIVSAANIHLKFDPVEKNYAPADAQAAQAVVKILAEEDPDILFLYIGQVDETGHANGFHPSVKKYVAAIEQADRHVGEVIEAVRARKTFPDEEWLVLVTSDHGGRGTGHGGGHNVPEIRNSFLIVSGPAAKRGALDEDTYLVDAPATALGYLGAEAKPQWQLDGRVVGLKQ
jgi:predicted AlkP superfamily pyrophosphatase or phosphodiesterase